MKLAPKHYRLLSLLQERGSVPARIRPVIREELVAMGLAEYFHGEEWLREKERYRLTKQGRELLENTIKGLSRKSSVPPVSHGHFVLEGRERTATASLDASSLQTSLDRAF